MAVVGLLLHRGGENKQLTMKNVQHIDAELTKYRNELATLRKAQDDLLKEAARGGGDRFRLQK